MQYFMKEGYSIKEAQILEPLPRMQVFVPLFSELHRSQKQPCLPLGLY